MGRGHGRFGFEAFSNARGILEQRSSVSAVKWLAPPYTLAKKRLIDFLVRFL
jgi:aldehyde dehydrogenase (NAD+)